MISRSKKKNNNITIVSGGPELLGHVAPLWNKLKRFHAEVSLYFGNSIARSSFSKRKKQLLNIAKQGRLKIDLAQLLSNRKYIGYCISSVDKNKNGEIQSLFIESQYRKKGIGSLFIKRALLWMKKEKAKSKTVYFVHGNEKVFSFYSKFGFLPYSIMLRNKRNG